MTNKTFFSLLLSVMFLFSANFALAQTCSDPTDPVSEVGQCRSSCSGAAEHQISGTCIGQVCCATNPSAGFPTDTAKTTTAVSAFDECIAQGGDYNDCKDRAGAPASASTSTGALLPDGAICAGSSTCQSGSCVANASGQFVCASSSGTGTGASSASSFSVASSGSTGATASGGWSLGNIYGFGLPSGSVFRIITNILVWLLGLFGIIGILGFLISGIIYLTAAGDEDRMAYAKRAMQYSIIGVIVGLIGFVIIQAIDYALNTYSSF